VIPVRSHSTRPKRRQILVDREVQLRLATTAMLATASAVFLVTALTAASFARLAERLPNDGAQVLAALPGTLALAAGLALVATVPWLGLMIVLGTFRVVGPLVRFRQFLRDVASGAQVEPCRIRTGDHLQDVCALLNEATSPLLERNRAAAAEREGAGQGEAESQPDRTRSAA
jgi:hypothetical protein